MGVSDRGTIKEFFVKLKELYNFAVESFCVSLKIIKKYFQNTIFAYRKCMGNEIEVTF